MKGFIQSMKQKEVMLTPADRLILASYRELVYGLEDYLGEGFEIVLHSLESMEHSVIAIANGHYTNRREGSPITDLALDMLHSIKQDSQKSYMSYFSRNSRGEPLHSTTIVLHGENKRAIGLLCINFYLNTPIHKMISHLTENALETHPMLSETFADNAEELLTRVVDQIKAEVDQDHRILPSMKNKEIIRRCNNLGVFQIKNAVTSVSRILNISKNTVYLHLKSLE